jgi:hypothetical protein
MAALNIHAGNSPSGSLRIGETLFDVISVPLNPNTLDLEVLAFVPIGMSCNDVQQYVGTAVGPFTWHRHGCGTVTHNRLMLNRCRFAATEIAVGGTFTVTMDLRRLKDEPAPQPTGQFNLPQVQGIARNATAFIVGVGEFPVPACVYHEDPGTVSGSASIRCGKHLPLPLDSASLKGKLVSVFVRSGDKERLIRHAVIQSAKSDGPEQIGIEFNYGHFETPAADWKSLPAYGAPNQGSTVQWKMPPASWLDFPDEFINTQPFMPSPKQFGPSPLAGALKNYSDAAALSAAAASIMSLSPKPVGAKVEPPKPKPPEVAIPPKPRRKFFDDP